MKTLGDFRKLTAKLPDDTPLLTDAPDHSYRYIECCVTTAVAHICAWPAMYDPDCGDDPDLYGHASVAAVIRNRKTVVVIA